MTCVCVWLLFNAGNSVLIWILDFWMDGSKIERSGGTLCMHWTGIECVSVCACVRACVTSVWASESKLAVCAIMGINFVWVVSNWNCGRLSEVLVSFGSNCGRIPENWALLLPCHLISAHKHTYFCIILMKIAPGFDIVLLHNCE